MNRKLIAVPAIAITAAISLAACSTTHTVVVKPAVTHTVTAPAPKPSVKTVTASPKVVVKPAPAKTVYVQAPAAAPAENPGPRACGSGVYANVNTSCSFAFDVEQAYVSGPYWNQPGTSYLTVDGVPMVSASVGNPVIVTGGDYYVQFDY